MDSKLFLMAAACSAILSGCGDSQPQTFTKSVMVVSPQRVGGQVARTFSGVIKEAKEISVGFKTPGQISKINVKEGDYVREGQLIATLDDSDYKLGVSAAQIQFNQMKDEVARLEKLYNGQSLSGNDYEKAKAGLQQLEVQLQSNVNKLNYTKLYAPSSGYIQSVNFEESEMVDAGTSVFTLIDTRSLEVVTNIPSDIYLLRQKFTSIECTSPNNPSQKYAMKILSVAPKADGNQLYALRLGFDAKSAKESDTVGDQRIFERFIDLVKIHYAESRSVTFYADKICVTPQYLSHAVYITPRASTRCIGSAIM